MAILLLWHFMQRTISDDTFKMGKHAQFRNLMFFSRISKAYAFGSSLIILRNPALKIRLTSHTALNIENLIFGLDKNHWILGNQSLNLLALC